jgi:hypothetical protein
MKICLVGTEFFHSDGLTEVKIIVALRNFANEPKSCPVTCQTDIGGGRGISQPVLDPGPRGSGLLAPRFGRFTPEKETLYPPYRRLGGPRGRSGWVW